MNPYRHRVILTRLTTVCPSCGAPGEAWTHPRLGTRIRSGCSPHRCRIARVKTLAGAPFPSWFEPAPLDDRDTPRRKLLGGGVA